MKSITLYKYFREDGGVSVSPVPPDTNYDVLYRIIADEGKLVTMNDIDAYSCVDSEVSEEWWHEIDDPDYEPEEVIIDADS